MLYCITLLMRGNTSVSSSLLQDDKVYCVTIENLDVMGSAHLVHFKLIPFNHDAAKCKALAYTGVPADMAKTMPAGEWLKVALDVLGGRGGGKPTNAQGQGPHIDKLPEAMDAARAHADRVLSKSG